MVETDAWFWELEDGAYANGDSCACDGWGLVWMILVDARFGCGFIVSVRVRQIKEEIDSCRSGLFIEK